MQNKSVLHFAAIALSAVVLAGCSGEPSGGDIQSALQANLDQTIDQAKAMGGGKMIEQMTPKLISAKKIGCEEAGKDSYGCNVEIVMMMPGASKESKTVTKINLVKGTDGWVVTR